MTDVTDEPWLERRRFVHTTMVGFAAGLATTGDPGDARAEAKPAAPPRAFARLRDRPLHIGILIYPDMDQIDFTGPFEVLARMPNATVHAIGARPGPFRDYLGMTLTPDVALADAPVLDVLQVPGGPGQQALMADAAVLGWLRAHMAADKPVFSVCTGALLCGAAGILRGRRATTHWAAFDLLPYFGAIAVRERVVIDGNLMSAAGVTAGIDGALRLVSLLRDDAAAQRIQLGIQYAPEPPFRAGSPDTAPGDVLAAVTAKYQPLTAARLATARRIAVELGISLRGSQP
jgi:cyclohexyl-isocyanide hydratase